LARILKIKNLETSRRNDTEAEPIKSIKNNNSVKSLPNKNNDLEIIDENGDNENNLDEVQISNGSDVPLNENKIEK